jgi:two-component system NtrC family sensor kinase
MQLYMLPSVITDIIGSLVMIILSFLSLRYTFLLTRREPDNFLWGFLHYFCMTLVVFSISRAVGHMVKQALLISDQKEMWNLLSPYSGGLNTLLMISASAVTIYYHKGVEGYRAIQQKAESLKLANRSLEEAGETMKEMNLRLEEMVASRTVDLTLSEEKFRNFFHNSKDMVFFCDQDGNVMDMNRAGLEMLDYSGDTTPNFSLEHLFADQAGLQNFDSTLRSQKFVEDFEAEFTKQDGSIVYTLLSATALYDEHGHFRGCEGIAKDLTRLKAMTSQMISTEKMASVGQMAAGVAHEINTPLGIILGYSQLMKDDFSTDSEEYENLVVVERQSHACRKIVADLLKFSRQSGSSQMDVHVNEILTDVLAITEHNLTLDHIEIDKCLADDLPVITGDEEKLRQVFVNLINNAQHAMEDEGGVLTVRTRFSEEEQMITASVIDTGTGIEPAIKNRIFDPFFTTKSVGRGTGLGLSVSYGIIEDHNGTITVESPVMHKGTIQLSKGTAMHIQLPVSQ